ncbi:MAG: hypothetical protein ACK6A4_17730, partial [Alphaproteobacteria bacterium]
MSLQARLKSVAHAWSGLRELVATEANATINHAASRAVLPQGLRRRRAHGEWLASILEATLGWMSEALN